MTTTQLMKRGKNEADTLRLNGWGPGDILEGDEGHGPDRIKIVAMTEELFICRWDYGATGEFGKENRRTTLSCREWYKVGHEPVGTPGAHWRVRGDADPHGDRYNGERADLCQGDMTDDELANTVYLDPNIGNLTAAKERIRWLSRRLADATNTPATPVPEGLRQAIMQVRPLICNCSWNPDDHAADCPVKILDTALFAALEDAQGQSDETAADQPDHSCARVRYPGAVSSDSPEAAQSTQAEGINP
ncbi:MAG: hypothetical protein AWU57_623 [Marinobacter sp. T13-3]|nr:MAG: hypothetical protein AWU57_623 [Marinobacter sp. T13-3]